MAWYKSDRYRDTASISNDANNYSSDEKVIGTWVNGKPLYQKTVSDGSTISGIDVTVQEFKSAEISKGSTLSSLIPVVSQAVDNISYSTKYRSDYDGWYAFDSNDTGTDWSTAYNDTESWLQWTFDTGAYIDNISLKNVRTHSDADTIPKVTILGLNLLTEEWETLLELTPSATTYTYTEESINSACKDTCYKAVRVQHTRTTTSNKNAFVSDFRVNGYVAQVTVYDTVRYTKTADSAVASGEKIVGQWIDGKAIYEKVIETGALPNNTTKGVNHNIANIDKILNLFGFAYKTNGDRLNLPNVSPTASANVHLNADTSLIALMTGSDRSTYTTSYVTIQYTKTTD